MPRILPQSYVGGRSASAADAGVTFGPLAQAVDEMAQRAARAEETYKVNRVNGAVARAAGELAEFNYYLKNGSQNEDGTLAPPPSAAQHYTLYQERVKDINKRMKESLGDDSLYGMYEQDFGAVALKTSFDVRSHAADKMRGEASAELSLAVDTLAGVASQSDEAGRQLIHGRVKDMIARNIAIGAETPEAGLARLQEYNRTLSRADIKAGLMADPEAVAVKLLDGDFAGVASPEERQEWLKAAHNAVNERVTSAMAALDRARSDAERAQRQAEYETAKTGFELVAQGKLDTRWVVQNRSKLSEDRYKYFLEESTGVGSVQTKPEVYAPLRLRASRGEDVRNEAEAALYARDISAESFNLIVSEVEQASSTGQVPDLYKRGAQYLNTYMDTSNIAANPARKQMAANVLDSWTRWFKAHPDATDAEGEEEFKRLAYSATLANLQELTVSLPLARGMNNTRARSPEELKAQIVAAFRAAEEARKSGQLDAFEYKEEIKLLDEWGNALKAWERTSNAN